jgi:dihydrofolate reductase
MYYSSPYLILLPTLKYHKRNNKAPLYNYFMSKVVLDMTMSLDGFIAGPDDDVKESLHNWLFNGATQSAVSDYFHTSKESAPVFDHLAKTSGAIVAGRRTYDLTGGWNGSHPFLGLPMFVVSHDVPKIVPQGSTPFTFVTDGVEDAIHQAKRAAGGKNVYLLGGASVAQQCINLGLVDEIMIHLVPILLCGGIRLFENLEQGYIQLEQTEVVKAPGVTHLRFRQRGKKL